MLAGSYEFFLYQTDRDLFRLITFRGVQIDLQLESTLMPRRYSLVCASTTNSARIRPITLDFYRNIYKKRNFPMHAEISFLSSGKQGRYQQEQCQKATKQRRSRSWKEKRLSGSGLRCTSVIFLPGAFIILCMKQLIML